MMLFIVVTFLIALLIIVDPLSDHGPVRSRKTRISLLRGFLVEVEYFDMKE